MRSGTGIAFDFRPSRGIAAAYVAVSLAAVAAPWQSAVPTSARIALSIATCVFGFVSLRNFLTTAIRRIAYRASGWTLVDSDGTECPVELASHARVGGWIALTFRDSARRVFRVALGPDNLDPDTRRRLIVMLSRAEVVQRG